MTPSVSVILSTANRPARFVARLLDRLREQSYRPLEIVLVVGPCPDDMKALAESLDDVKVRFIEALNLAESRNIGIATSSGEILAFVDDDAVPSPLWIHELVEAMEAEGPSCGGIGGATILANASPSPFMQNRHSIVDAMGDTSACVLLEPGRDNDPDGPWFNRLHGCNMAFRREAMEAVGGFDEAFAYQHEETDLCIRLIRRGYRIVHHSRALVDHYPTTSHFRRDAYDISYVNILRSYTYFGLKHARRPFAAVAASSFRNHLPYFKRFLLWTLACQISPWRAAKFVAQWVEGYAKGLRLGWNWRRGGASQKPLNGSPRHEFRPIASPPSWSPKVIDGTHPLRVAIACDELGGPSPGGVAVYTEYLAEGLARLGHEVVVFRTGYGPGEARPKGYRVVGVPAEPDRPRGVSLLQAIRSLGPFDVVEAPLWGGEGAAAGMSGWFPLVVRLETPLEVVRQVSGLPLSREMIEAIAGERLGLSYAAGAIAISHAIAETVESIYDAKLANAARLATTIPIGLPGAETLAMDDADLPASEGVNLLYVGRLEARKGILELGKAFAQAATSDSRLRLWIAGGDNSESDGHRARTGQSYEQTLRRMWGPELSRRVTFLGRVSEGRKNALMARCDVFVAPSLYESFGIVFVEAMRMGKPVIGSRVGGIPEIVLDGETGILVDPLDPSDLARAMMRLSADAEARTRMGNAGFERFQAHFTMVEFARRSADFYREVLAHWHGSRFALEAAGAATRAA